MNFDTLLGKIDCKVEPVGKDINSVLAVCATDRNLVDFERIEPSPEWSQTTVEDVREMFFGWALDHWGTAHYASDAHLDGNAVRFTARAWKTPLPILKKLASLVGCEMVVRTIAVEKMNGHYYYHKETLAIDPVGKVDTIREESFPY